MTKSSCVTCANGKKIRKQERKDDMKNIGVGTMTMGRRVITEPNGKGHGPKDPPAINRLVTFGDEEGKKECAYLYAMKTAGLAYYEELPVTEFNVHQKIWHLTPKGIAWIIACDEDYCKWRELHVQMTRAEKKLKRTQAAFKEEWAATHDEKEEPQYEGQPEEEDTQTSE